MRNDGFTLIELLLVVIILGIIAGIAIPHMRSQIEDVKQSSLDANLGVIRKAIEVFHSEHRGTYPGFPNGRTSATPSEADFLNHMLQKTDPDCSVDANGSCGPYLRPGFPLNPMNKKMAILVSKDAATDPGMDSDYGWYYTAATGEFNAVSDEGGGAEEEAEEAEEGAGGPAGPRSPGLTPM